MDRHILDLNATEVSGDGVVFYDLFLEATQGAENWKHENEMISDQYRDSLQRGLRDYFCAQLKREGTLYLNTMKGILENGWSHVASARQKAEELENDERYSSEIVTSYGFNSVSTILEMFQRYYEDARVRTRI